MAETANGQTQKMQRFYRRHAVIYDVTRWAFLFGRKNILNRLPGGDSQLLVEIGCGTGHNLCYLARKYKDWRLVGFDVSPDMLARASRATGAASHRVQLFEQAYGAGANHFSEAPDIILFSYSLTMFNPGWEEAIDQAWRDLKPGGHIAVTDFHDTTTPAFRWWMRRNHVRMDGHLLPALQARFQSRWQLIQPAWSGLWQYFMFVGQKCV